MPLEDGGVVYPTWQFLSNGATIPALVDVLSALAASTDDTWMIALWMQAPSEHLDGQRPSEWLRDGGDPERVISLGRGIAARWRAWRVHEQGAESYPDHPICRSFPGGAFALISFSTARRPSAIRTGGSLRISPGASTSLRPTERVTSQRMSTPRCENVSGTSSLSRAWSPSKPRREPRCRPCRFPPRAGSPTPVIATPRFGMTRELGTCASYDVPQAWAAAPREWQARRDPVPKTVPRRRTPQRSRALRHRGSARVAHRPEPGRRHPSLYRHRHHRGPPTHPQGDTHTGTTGLTYPCPCRKFAPGSHIGFESVCPTHGGPPVRDRHPWLLLRPRRFRRTAPPGCCRTHSCAPRPRAPLPRSSPPVGLIQIRQRAWFVLALARPARPTAHVSPVWPGATPKVHRPSTSTSSWTTPQPPNEIGPPARSRESDARH